MSRFILGIDPGTVQTGWALYDRDAARVAHSGTAANDTMLRILADLAVDERYRPELVVVERFASYGMSIGQTTIDAIEWAGRFFEAARAAGFEPVRMFRRDVKLYLCGTARAKDGNVRQRIIDLHDPTGADGKGNPSAIGTKAAPGPLYGVSGDGWAALAVVLAAIGEEAGE